jgi:hypothetical protein
MPEGRIAPDDVDRRRDPNATVEEDEVAALQPTVLGRPNPAQLRPETLLEALDMFDDQFPGLRPFRLSS